MSNLSDYISAGSNGGSSGGQLYTVSWSAPTATGGETVLAPPYTFNSAMVFINGVAQDETRGAFSIESNRVLLSTPLNEGDESQVIMGQVLPPGSSNWNLITDDVTLISGQPIAIDTHLRAINLVLPANPEDGDIIEIVDIGGNLEVNNATIKGNGRLMMESSNDLIIKTDYIHISLLYVNQHYGWCILD